MTCKDNHDFTPEPRQEKRMQLHKRNMRSLPDFGKKWDVSRMTGEANGIMFIIYTIQGNSLLLLLFISPSLSHKNMIQRRGLCTV